MKLFLDSGNLDTIYKGLTEFKLAGVTTNPTILARDMGDLPLDQHLKKIRGIVSDCCDNDTGKMLFVQVSSFESDKMTLEALRIVDFLSMDSQHLSIKIPMGTEGIRSIRELANRGVSVTATAVYSTSQALMAANSGASYAAPYVSHLDNLGFDGAVEAGKMANVLSANNFTTEVLAASFRTVSQVQRCFENGVTCATVTYEMLKTMSSHPGSEKECMSFEKNWKERFGEKGILDLLN